MEITILKKKYILGIMGLLKSLIVIKRGISLERYINRYYTIKTVKNALKEINKN